MYVDMYIISVVGEYILCDESLVEEVYNLFSGTSVNDTEPFNTVGVDLNNYYLGCCFSQSSILFMNQTWMDISQRLHERTHRESERGCSI